MRREFKNRNFWVMLGTDGLLVYAIRRQKLFLTPVPSAGATGRADQKELSKPQTPLPISALSRFG